MGKLSKACLVSVASGVVALSVCGVVVAYTNPELLDLVTLTADYGLKGLKAYFDFLLELFKEAASKLA